MAKTMFASKLSMPALAIVACAAAVVVSYCGKKEEDAKVEAKFSSIYSNVLVGCAKCHKPGTEVYTNSVQNLDLSSQSAAYASLSKNMQAPVLKPLCSGSKYVKASDSANSVLMGVLDEATRVAFSANNGGCDPMALSEMDSLSSVSADAVTAIKQWIDAGAANN
jgi:hypothetical protein